MQAVYNSSFLLANYQLSAEFYLDDEHAVSIKLASACNECLSIHGFLH